MDSIIFSSGLEIFTAALVIILCIMVVNVIVRSHKIEKIYKRTLKMSGYVNTSDSIINPSSDY